MSSQVTQTTTKDFLITSTKTFRGELATAAVENILTGLSVSAGLKASVVTEAQPNGPNI